MEHPPQDPRPQEAGSTKTDTGQPEGLRDAKILRRPMSVFGGISKNKNHRRKKTSKI